MPVFILLTNIIFSTQKMPIFDKNQIKADFLQHLISIFAHRSLRDHITGCLLKPACCIFYKPFFSFYWIFLHGNSWIPGCRSNWGFIGFNWRRRINTIWKTVFPRWRAAIWLVRPITLRRSTRWRANPTPPASPKGRPWRLAASPARGP